MFLPISFTTTALAAGLALAKRPSSIPSSVPDFVTQHAPIIRLSSSDPYRPADIASQLSNTIPKINSTSIPSSSIPSPLTLSNLADLNSIPNSRDGKDIYLTSTLDPTTSPRPQYLHGVLPNATTGKTEHAISSAIITVDKGSDTIDAFYFYFYAFDYGGDYLDRSLNVGNHVGDWEQNAIRFIHGIPQSIWYSQHASGQAFEFSVTEKYHPPPSPSSSPDDNFSERPIVYSATGTHANYATPGTHDHLIPGVTLPAGFLEDHSDAGPLWDPTLAAYYYEYDPASQQFTAYDGEAPTEWLAFRGRWGDEKYAKVSLVFLE
jgi:hypothetical protein